MPISTSLRRWAPVFQVFTIIAMVGVVLVVVLGALFWDLPDDLRAEAGLAPGIAFSRPALMGIVAIGALPSLAMLFVLGHMAGLFRKYGVGETLTPACARHIRHIGAGLLVAAALSMITRALQVMVISFANPPGERVLAIRFEGMDLSLVLAGGLLLTIGWAMGDAVRAARENAEFV